MKTCIEPGCSSVEIARGYCRRCYTRLRRNGRLEVKRGIRRRDPVERFFEKVDAEGICWQWGGASGANGYGQFSIQGRTYVAHRWCWEYLVESIPSEMTIDHLCLNKMCVNPDHLEVVTRAENSRRAQFRHHCPKGHSMGDALTCRTTGNRKCRTCHYARNAAYRRAKREA